MSIVVRNHQQKHLSVCPDNNYGSNIVKNLQMTVNFIKIFAFHVNKVKCYGVQKK